MKLFDNPKKAVYVILAFLVLYFVFRAGEARADGFVGLGPSEINGYGLVYTERLGGKWDLGLQLVSDQEWEGDKSVGNNGGVTVSRVVTKNNWDLMLGASAWVSTSRVIGCHLGFHLGAGYNLTDRVAVRLSHWSNAGTCERNRGQNLLLIGWRF